MDHQLARFAGIILIVLCIPVIITIVHSTARGIFGNRPRKKFRDWLSGWIAGPELLVLGTFFKLAWQDEPGSELSVLFCIALQYVGLSMLLFKIVAYAVPRFRRRARGVAGELPPTPSTRP